MDLQTLLSIISIIVNIIGFFFIIKQITQQALATKGETYTSMCSLSYEILEMIFENPFLYDYFYNNKKLEDNNENKIKILNGIKCGRKNRKTTDRLRSKERFE